jgi:hypothetical protein
MTSEIIGMASAEIITPRSRISAANRLFLAVVFSPKKWGDFQENRWNNGDELPGDFR